jgi:signal transduction histidine kinase
LAFAVPVPQVPLAVAPLSERDLAVVNILQGAPVPLDIARLIAAFYETPSEARASSQMRLAFFGAQFHDLGNALNAVSLVELLDLNMANAAANDDVLAQVQDAQRQAISLRNASMRTLRGEAAQEFNVPADTFVRYLNAIARGVERLALDGTSQENPINLAAIFSALGEAESIMRVLAQWSQMGIGLQMQTREATPDDILMPVVRSLRDRATQAQVTVMAPQPQSGSQGRLMVDLSMVHRVVRNLLGNAIKFTRRNGKVWITMSIEDGPSPGFVWLKLEVADEGPGVEEQDRHRLFQPYSQINAQRLQGGGGHGLGIWVSRRIIESVTVGRFQGQIYHRHRDGGGSVFGFRVPLKLVTRAPSIDAKHKGMTIEILP